MTAKLINREVDRNRPKPIPAMMVQGHIRLKDGRPVTDYTVQAIDKDLRSEERLGESTPDRNGFYIIRYTAEQFTRAEKQSADLIVKVLNPEQKELVASDVIFNAPNVQTVDFVLEEQDRISEFERYETDIRPILNGLSFADLKEDDISFIAGETGIPHLHVAFLTLAHQYQQTTAIEAAAFYGLFRMDLPSNLSALLLQPSANIQRVLEAAIKQTIIPDELGSALGRLLTAFKGQVNERILASTDGQEVLPRLLNIAGLSRPEQETFLDSYLNFEGDIEAFWHSVQSTPLAPKIQSLQTTLQLGLVTQNNIPLISALQAKNIHSIRDIPQLSPHEFEEVILDSTEILAAIQADESTETNVQKAKRTVEGIHEILNAAIPTAFVRAAYEKSTDPLRKEVAQVLSSATELELRDDHIDRYLEANPHVIEGVNNVEAVKSQLKSIQRALRVATNAEHAEVLLSANLDSAQAVASMAPLAFEEAFAEQFGGKQQAMLYYQKAQHIQSSSAAIYIHAKQSLQDVTPAVIQPTPASVKDLPDFSSLFGSQNSCACEHCGSVLSPAAYLVDLLELINPKYGEKPITALNRRRPYIEHIPLSCENTKTSLPYIDLVNEVLEFYVANGEITADAAQDTKGLNETELSITPQYLIESAYTKLSEAVYPQSFPFDRPLEQIRLYLEQQGTSLYELLQVFKEDSQAEETALEYLKISRFEQLILIGSTNKSFAEFYGFQGDEDLSSHTEIKAADFLSRTLLTYDELVDLLAMNALNPAHSIKLEDDNNPPLCDLAHITLKPLTIEFWEKAHQVVRLKRKLGWSFHELDVAIRVFHSTEINQPLLQKLSIA